MLPKPPPREIRPPPRRPRGPSLLVIRPAAVRAEELKPKLEDLARATGLDPFMARQRFLGRSLLVLEEEDQPEPLAARAGAIREAGAGAVVLPRAALEELPEPVRAACIQIRGDRPVFQGVQGRELLAVEPADRILLVLADLGSRDSLGQRVSRKPAAESAHREGCWEGPILLAGRGRAVLEIFAWKPGAEGAPVRLRLYGERFNFTGLDGDSLSRSRNMAALVRLLAETAGEVELDLDFGEGATQEEPEETFGQHAALAYLAHRAGLPPPPPVETNRAIRESAQAAHQVRQAAPVVDGKGRFRRGKLFDSSKELAPAWIAVPLSLAVIPLFAIASITENRFWFGPLLVDLGLLAFAIGLTALARRRYIQNVPTAKVRSMPMGMVELRGRARQTVPLKTPFSGLDCIYYRYYVFAWVQTSKGAQKRCVGSGSSGDVPFYLEDDTGRVLVDPVGAHMDIHHTEKRAQGQIHPGMPGARETVEVFIPTHFPLYVTGTAHRRTVQPEGTDRKLRERLDRIRHDPNLRSRYDLNGDGRLDAQEWDRAREELRRELGETGPEAPVEHVVVGRGTGRLFLISDRTEERLLRSQAWRIIVGLGLGVALTLAGVALMLA